MIYPFKSNVLPSRVLMLVVIRNIGAIPKPIPSVHTKGSRGLIKIDLGYNIRDTVKIGLPQWR